MNCIPHRDPEAAIDRLMEEIAELKEKLKIYKYTDEDINDAYDNGYDDAESVFDNAD